MKSLLLGVVVILVLGVGGLVYRNAVEHPNQPIACPVNYFKCPDGTSVPHLSNSCEFPECPPPNVSLADSGVAFALPEGFTEAELFDGTTIASYERKSASTTQSIVIRRFAINASSTALETIRETALGGTSGEPVPATAFSSVFLGGKNFTVVAIDRFEGVIDIAYYLARPTDVLRFDAIDRDVLNWMSQSLDVSTLPANKALRQLLTTLE